MAFDAHSTAAPAEHPAASRHRLRQNLCTLIERLITALDAIDGDPDIEDQGDDEPSLAFQEARADDCQDNIIRWSPTDGPEWTDLEIACEDEGGQHDGREPEHFGGSEPAFLMDQREGEFVG